MTGNALDLIGQVDVWVWQALAVFLRCGAVVALMPAFGERSVPMRVKLGLTMALTAVVAPGAPDAPLKSLIEVSIPFFLYFACAEAVTGLFLGLTLRLFVLVLQTAGSMAAQSTSLAQVLGGAAAEPLPAVGYVLVVGGLALAVMAGLHVDVARFLLASYDLVPVGRFPSVALVSEGGLAQVAGCFGLALSLAAPFVIASLLYNLTLGVINRAMPQLMVALVGAPVITCGALVTLMLCAPMILLAWREALMTFLANPAAMPR